MAKLFKKNNHKGFSLVESLLGIVMVGLIVFLIANIPSALMLIKKSRHLSLAREIAHKQIEDKRTINYLNLGTGNSPIDDARLSSLPSGSGTVIVGYELENGEWIDCDTSICKNEEKAKQVRVEITWQDNNKTQRVDIQTIIAEGGINQ